MMVERIVGKVCLWTAIMKNLLLHFCHLFPVQDIHVLLAVIVDYRGHRVFAQSLIPGLLQREDDTAIMYGSLDCGKSFTDNDKARTLVSVQESGALPVPSWLDSHSSSTSAKEISRGVPPQTTQVRNTSTSLVIPILI